MKTLLILMTILGGPSVVLAQGGDSDAWQQFRQKFPYHIQTVAISTPTAPLGSEPSSSASRRRRSRLRHSLRDRFGNRISRMAVRRHGIGVDGWVKDVTGTLDSMSDIELNLLVGDLNRELFGTLVQGARVDVRYPAGRRASREP